MSDYLKDKMSIGLSLSVSLNEYKELFDKYDGYIHSIYFSPPLNGKYHSREIITEQFKIPDNVSKFYNILQLAKERKIKLDCVLNRPSLGYSDVITAVDCIKDICVDQITCLGKHIAIIDDEFPLVEKIYSYNNDFQISDLADVSSKFSTIVVGKYFLRSPELLKKIAQSGFKLKLLVNNGCSYNCRGCMSGNIQCGETFKSNLKKYSVEYLYALQSFYPEELKKILGDDSLPVESVKISNRTDGYQYLDNCLDSYINLVSPDKYISENVKNYRLWSRLASFNPYFSEIDSNAIAKIKTKEFKC